MSLFGKVLPWKLNGFSEDSKIAIKSKEIKLRSHLAADFGLEQHWEKFNHGIKKRLD